VHRQQQRFVVFRVEQRHGERYFDGQRRRGSLDGFCSCCHVYLILAEGSRGCKFLSINFLQIFDLRFRLYANVFLLTLLQSGATFFDDWDVWSYPDPTHGTVNVSSSFHLSFIFPCSDGS
jgi:hypothetical protein